MIIKLLHPYKGKASAYEKLPAGVQGVTDELGEYLVTNGHAIAIESPKAETVTGIEAVYAIGVDSAEPEQDTTIETLVSFVPDIPETVTEVEPPAPTPTAKPKSKR